MFSADVWLSVPLPLCMPGLWRDGRAVVLLKPAEWLAWMRVLKPFLHVSACPDVLLCTDCVLVGCATVIGWSVGVVLVSRHEQNVSLWPGCSPLVCGCLCRRACWGCGETGGQRFAEMGWRLHEDESAAWILTVICAVDGRVVACICRLPVPQQSRLARSLVTQL